MNEKCGNICGQRVARGPLVEYHCIVDVCHVDNNNAFICKFFLSTGKSFIKLLFETF
jgi:hypothetical protein